MLAGKYLRSEIVESKNICILHLERDSINNYSSKNIYWIIYLKVAKEVDLKSFHHRK